MPRDVKNMVLGEVFSHLRKLLQILSEGVDLISQKFRKQFVAEGKMIRGYVKLLSLNFAFRLVGIGACIFFTHGVRTSLHGSAQHKAADGRGRTLFVWSRIIVADDCKFARYQFDAVYRQRVTTILV